MSDSDKRPAAMAEDGERVCLGAIAGAHGVRGLARIKSFTADPLSIGAYGSLTDDKGQRHFDLTIKGQVKGAVLVAIKGVTDRDQVQALQGTRLYVLRSALPEPEDEEEFYNADLIGLRVEDRSGTVLGSIKAMHNFGGGDLIEVQPCPESDKGQGAQSSWLMAFTRVAVPVVDLAGGRVVVEPPEEVVAGDAKSGS